MARTSALLPLLIAIALFLAAEAAIQARVSDQVYLDITVGGKAAGRIIIGLFGEYVFPLFKDNRSHQRRMPCRANHLTFL